jgi:hypothetical protein
VNPILRNAVSADIARAVATAKAVDAIEHLETRGRVREVLISDLFRPLLPTTFDIMTGILVDHTGGSALNQSGQEDILIYSREALPGGLRLAETGLLPIEACVAVIEVKSTLTADGIRQSIEHSQRVRRLQTIYHTKPKATTFMWNLEFATYPIYNVFALKSDLTSTDEWDRFKTLHSEMGLEDSSVFAACIVETGMAYWRGSKENSAGLIPCKTQIKEPDFGEVIAFLSIVSDFARMIRKLKLNELPLPGFTNYLVE